MMYRDRRPPLVRAEEALSALLGVADLPTATLVAEAARHESLAASHSAAGDDEAALTHAILAVAVRRRLVRSQRDVHLAALAVALLQLAHYDLWSASPHHLQEAVELFRAVSLKDRAAALPHMAQGVRMLADHLCTRPDQRLALIEEAIRLYRELGGHLRELARCFTHLSHWLVRNDEDQAALGAANEAVSLLKEVGGSDVDFLLELAGAHHWAAELQHLVGQHQAALGAEDEGIELRRRIDAVAPGQFPAQLGSHLTIQAFRRLRNGDHDAALGLAEEAVALQRHAAAGSSIYDGDLADALAALARCLHAVNRHTDAASTRREVRSIRRRVRIALRRDLERP